MELVLGILVGIGLALAARALIRRDPVTPAPPLRAVETPEPGDDDDRQSAEIVEAVAEGVLVLGPGLDLVHANSAARRMLGFEGPRLPRRLSSEEVLGVAQRAGKVAGPIEEVLSLWYPKFQTLRVRASLLSDGNVLVLLEDVTEESMAQKVRREFVAHASHELKTPVAGIQALAETINQALVDDPDAAARFAGRLASEAHRLARLINDLLDLTRLEESVEIPRGPVDLADVVFGEIEGLRALAGAKSIELAADVPRELPARGDASQLGLLVRNLLDNAIRYTPEGGVVKVTARRENGIATVEVSDTGIGIPRESRARVFERFYRVDKARSRDRGGTGLGLAIVKHVAELHGGAVAVDSELGKGSTFIVRIPVTQAETPAPSPATEEII